MNSLCFLLMRKRFVRNGKLEVRTVKEDDGLMLFFGKNCGVGEIQRAVCQPRSGDDW